MKSLSARMACSGFVLMMVLLATTLPATVSPVHAGSAYHDQPALMKALKDLARAGGRVTLHELARTPARNALPMLQVAPRRSGSGPPAAVLVVADPLGTTPLATEAALQLARLLIAESRSDTPERAQQLTWYIMPRANPDGSARYFQRPRLEDGRNGQPVDDDKDGQADEDGPDDLNGDDLITTMLMPHPRGTWLLTEDNPPLPRQADPARGERGLYLRLREGRDDDGDGQYNEDGPGGIVPGKNFPHAFVHWTPDAGLWPAEAAESRAVLQFAFDHPEIALVVVLGAANNLARPPQPAGSPPSDKDKVRVPEQQAERMNLDPQGEYTLADLVELARDFTGDDELTREDVLALITPGAASVPDRRDLAWWNELATSYRAHLEEAGLNASRLEPEDSGPGSVEQWAYYQFGVPALALDFWSVPVPESAPLAGPDPATGMPGKPADGSGQPGARPPEAVATAIPEKDVAEVSRAEQTQAPTVDPGLKALAEYSRDSLGGAGWRPWQEVLLPDGREVLVGGAEPFALRTPPAALVDSLLAAQLPFLWRLVEWLPELQIPTVELDYRGADVYAVTVHVANRGRIPYPTFQGVRCQRAAPVAVTLEGAEVLEGRARQTIQQVPALGTASVRWLVRGKHGGKLSVRAAAAGLGETVKSVALKREGGLR